jgi:pimeloyl-ACP methyl ester carboxylesterase
MMTTRSRDGTSIAFDRSGSGQALVLVNGALSDRSSGSTLAALLAPRFTVFSFDRRGRGDSGDGATYSVDREIEDIAALIKEAGGSAFVFGHSSGAALSLEAAASGLAIRKLALYEPPFIVDASRPPMPRDYEDRLSALISSGRKGEAVEYFLATGPGVPAETIARMKNTPMWPAMLKMAHTLLYDAAIMAGKMDGLAPSPASWASVRMPCLLMDGGESPAWARRSVKILSEALPEARYLSLPGQTHSAAPELLVPALVEFFSD